MVCILSLFRPSVLPSHTQLGTCSHWSYACGIFLGVLEVHRTLLPIHTALCLVIGYILAEFSVAKWTTLPVDVCIHWVCHLSPGSMDYPSLSARGSIGLARGTD